MIHTPTLALLPRRAPWLFLFLLLPVLAAQQELTRLPDGVLLKQPAGLLQIQMRADNIVRVAFAKDPGFFNRPIIDVVPTAGPAPDWKLSSTETSVILTTARMQVVVDRRTGAVRFLDPAGQPISSEVPGGRIMEPADVQGERTWHVRQRWSEHAGESLFGLGQRQLNNLDIKGYDLDLWQHNTNIVVPFLVSSRGYGILWENLSLTRFGDLRPFEPIPPEYLFDSTGQQGGLTVQPLDGSAPPSFTSDVQVDPLAPSPTPKSRRWQGWIATPVSGDYQFQTYANGGVKLWIDNRPVFDHWRQAWLTTYDQAIVPLEGGRRYPIRLEWDIESADTLKLFWKTPNQDRATSLWSEVGEGIDYYFVYGPKLDDVIAGYRRLTGRAPLMPAWALGLWQSRERYVTSKESLDVIDEFRRRGIPFDNIVQDWQYWPIDAWGSHQFEASRFPDPNAWIKAIHEKHAHVMISVWPKFNPSTANARELQAHGFLLTSNLRSQVRDWLGYPATVYDTFNPEARKLYWSQIDRDLFQRGIDAWWMDASEPDCTPSPPTLEDLRQLIHPNAMGTGSRVLNGFPLLNAEAIYDGQRRSAPNQRVFTLTRSGYAGQQRYAAASWSGDITSTWTALARQIPAGLGFSISGVPWWTTDTAGFVPPDRFVGPNVTPENEQEWRELNARWFEFSAFCPLLRIHGQNRPREIWTLGGDSSPAYQAEVWFDRLRYHMFPYLYSLAGAITHRDYTLLRPLVMDFPSDPQAWKLTDEYMFGPALLVAPITKYQARSRAVYLPRGGAWYDFWTGQPATAGPLPDAPAPFDRIPVYVRAGSIVPFGPEIQYIGEKPEDPIAIYVYAGANGDFILYEDEGTNYNYEHGAFSEIPLHWDDTARTLTLGQRRGSFPGMPEHRRFDLVLVSAAHPSGYSFTPAASAHADYNGQAVTVDMK